MYIQLHLHTCYSNDDVPLAPRAQHKVALQYITILHDGVDGVNSNAVQVHTTAGNQSTTLACRAHDRDNEKIQQ